MSKKFYNPLKIVCLKAALIMFLMARAEQVFACYLPRTPEDKIEGSNFEAVVVGRIQEAEYTDKIKKGYRRWKGTVKIDIVVKGHVIGDTLQIGRSGSQTACDDGQPAPPEGQTWVLYIESRNSTLRVIHSFPLPIACVSDPNLPESVCKGLLHSHSSK